MEQWKDYSLLRPFDLEAAKNGALLTTCTNSVAAENPIWEFVAGPDAGGKILTKIIHTGCFADPAPVDCFRMAPLFWVEGRPAYPGDVLYWKCGVAEFIKAGDRILLGGQMVDGALVTTYGTSNGFTRRIDGIETLQENLTWEKSKRTVKKAGWINIYPLSWMDGRAGAIFQTKTEADSSARSGRIACTSVEWEEAIP